MIDLAVFDMAGTTVVDKSYVAKAFQKAFYKQDVTVSEADVNPVMGYSKPVAIQMVLKNQGVEFDGKFVQKIQEDFVEEMLDFYAYSPYVQPLAGAEDIFIYLQQKGVKIALNTGFSKEIAAVIVQRFQWVERGLVNDFIASDEVPAGRPAPYMIETLKKRSGLGQAIKVMKVGDTPVDIQEGKNAGCKYVIGVTTGASSKEELEVHKPTHIIQSLLEIQNILTQSVQAYV